MFCSNCGSKLQAGANFCSVCGAKIENEEPVKQEVKPIPEKVVSEVPHKEADEKPILTPKKNKVTFDWSNVIDEPLKKEVPDVRSPWSKTGAIDEKELYAEMTPSTDRSRTMSFIDMLKEEKESQKSSEDRFVEDAPVEAESKAEHAEEPAEEESQYSFYVPKLYDEREEVRTPFDTIASEEPVYAEDIIEEAEAEDVVEVSDEQPKETTDDFDFSILDDYKFEEEAVVESEEPKEEKSEAEAVSDLEAQLAAILSGGKGLVGKEAELSKSEEPQAPVEVEEPEVPEAPQAEIAEEEFENPEDAYLNLYADMPEQGIADATDVYTETVDKVEEAEFVAKPVEVEEPIPAVEAEDAVEEAIDEKELFEEIDAEAPKKTGMTIAAPADKESEIEALKRRLAELMDVSEEPEEIVKEDRIEVEDLFEDNSEDKVEETVVVEAGEEDALGDYLVQTVDYDKEPALVGDLSSEDVADSVEPAEGEATESTETDALSIEDLEKDIFGEESELEAESEATKKIDKFYTLYRKNEEFQRLLDEEYNKLKGDEEVGVVGGVKPVEVESDKPVVEVEEKSAEAVFNVKAEEPVQEKPAPVAFAAQAESVVATPAAPVEVGADLPATPAEVAPVAAAVDAKVAPAIIPDAAEEVKDALDGEEDEEEGGGALTIIAVILAVILVILLAVLLVLQLAPDSAVALKIDSLIENITSQFSAIDAVKNEFLL